MVELSLLDRFILKFTEEKLNNVTKIGRAYYLISPEIKDTMASISKKIHRPPFCAGLFLGEEKSKDFNPSVALIELIGHASDRWVMIDDNAEWLFLCDRDVFGSSVIKSNVQRGLAIVVNQRGEILGYGNVIGDLSNTDRIYIKNILDRGDYLRREMTGRHKSKK